MVLECVPALEHALLWNLASGCRQAGFGKNAPNLSVAKDAVLGRVCVGGRAAHYFSEVLR